MDDLLNFSQRVSLQVSLRHFEMSLRQAKAALNHPGTVNGVLYRQHLDISEEKRALIKKQIDVALGQIREMKELFSLEVEDENLARQVVSNISISWENLMDARTKRLRGYGKVHPALPGVLDPRIMNLSALALKLAALFEEDEAES